MRDVEISRSEVYEGSIYLVERAWADMERLAFKSNVVLDRGLISTHHWAFFKLLRSEFRDNEGMWDSALIEIDGPRWRRHYQPRPGDEDPRDADGYFFLKFEPQQSMSSWLREVTIAGTRTRYGGNIIKVVNSHLLLDRVTVESSRMYNKHGGIHLAFATLDVSDCTFDMGQPDVFYATAVVPEIRGELQGGFLFVSSNSSVTSTRNIYRGGRAVVGGCVALMADAEGTFTDDQFIRCSAVQGGAIYGQGFSRVTVIRSNFTDNNASAGEGENLFLQRYSGVTVLKNLSLDSVRNSIHLEHGADVDAEKLHLTRRAHVHHDPNATDKEIRYQVAVRGGGVHLGNMKQISRFHDVTMRDLEAEHGGCLYVGVDQLFREEHEYNTEAYRFSKLQLQGCFSIKDGAGVHVRNVRNMKIARCDKEGAGRDCGPSYVRGSTAEGAGGGVFFGCERPPKRSFRRMINGTEKEHTVHLDADDMCALDIVDLEVSGNTAYEGGGLKWRSSKPKFSMSRVRSNQATFYGNDFASQPTKMVRFLSKVEKDEEVMGHRARDRYESYKYRAIGEAAPAINESIAEFAATQMIKNVQSGTTIGAVYLALLDDFDQVVTTNTGAIVTHEISDEGTAITGSRAFFSANGVFNVSGLDIVTTPGQTGVTLTVIASEAAIKPRAGLLHNITFQLEIRGCILGEEQLPHGDNFVCRKCTAGRYLLEKPKLRETKECDPCPAEKAKCEGGSRIGPRKRYWRRNTSSAVFLRCPAEDENACLGLYRDEGGERLYSYTGHCGPGYYGALCSSCEPGYYRAGAYDCKKCADPTWNGLRIAGVLAVVVLVVVVLVKGTLASQARQQASSVFVKILLNHTQMLAIIASFDMQWPPDIADFLSSLAVLQAVQEAVVAFDCRIDTRTPDAVTPAQRGRVPDGERNITIINQIFTSELFSSPDGEWRVIYLKLVLHAAVPVLCGCCAYAAWYVVLKW